MMMVEGVVVYQEQMFVTLTLPLQSQDADQVEVDVDFEEIR